MNSLNSPLTESDISEFIYKKISTNEKLWIGYKGLNGYYQDVTQNGIRLFTKKIFENKKQVIGKNDFDIHRKSDWHLVELYQQHDYLAFQGKIWHGVEAAYLDGKLALFESLKKPVFDQQGNVVGSFYNLKQINNNFIPSIIEIIESFNSVTAAKNSTTLEFYLPDSYIQLTPREKECLFYTLRGKSAKSIGLILKISAKTVEFHLEHIKNKFNCFTKSQLISKAIDLGYFNKITYSILASVHKE